MNTLIRQDIAAYAAEYHLRGGVCRQWIHLMLHNRSFRSLWYYRKGRLTRALMWWLPGEPTLHLDRHCVLPGGTLFFHSFGTIIGPVVLGEQCRITCNIVLGFKDGKCPTIGNRVEILPGAVIAGDVMIGDDCVIGPNAVVYKSVPANCVVVGNPAIILKEKGVVVRRSL